MDNKFIYKNLALNYTKQGDGICILLVHGFGEDGSIFKHQVAVLEQNFTVIVPDLFGVGLSNSLPENITKNEAENLSSLEFYADALYALLLLLSIKRIIILGHSMGGYITMAFVEKYPNLVQKMGLIHSSAFADNDEKKLARQKGIQLMETYGGYAFLKNVIPTLFSEQYKKNNAELLESLIDRSKTYSTKALQFFYTAMINRKDTTAVLANTTIPVLFIIGKEDKAVLLTDIIKQVHLPKNAYIHILDNVAHMGMIEATEKVNTHILEFVN